MVSSEGCIGLLWSLAYLSDRNWVSFSFFEFFWFTITFWFGALLWLTASFFTLLTEECWLAFSSVIWFWNSFDCYFESFMLMEADPVFWLPWGFYAGEKNFDLPRGSAGLLAKKVEDDCLSDTGSKDMLKTSDLMVFDIEKSRDIDRSDCL